MASNTLKKDPEMKKKVTDWMNRNADCSIDDLRAAIPELSNYVNQSVAQTFNRHRPNAERIWKSGGAHGASQFRAALAETRRGAAVDLQTMVDGEETDVGSLMEPNLRPRQAAAAATRMMVSPTPGGTSSYTGIASIDGDWRPIHRIFEWNKPVDEGEAKVVYGVDIIPFSGSSGHTVCIEGNHTLVITADYPVAFGKPKAVHDTMGQDVMMKMMTDPNAKSTYDNLLVCGVAATQHMTRNRNERLQNHNKATFMVHFAKNIDKKNVSMTVVNHQYATGKWSKQLVVDVPQAVENEYVADLQVTSGSPVQLVAVCRTGETSEAN